MRKRTIDLLNCLDIDATTNPAFAALIDFAAQNPGLDARNYFSDWRDQNGRRAYAAEGRQISNDWRRVKTAAAEAVLLTLDDGGEVLNWSTLAFHYLTA